tara:strand:- start:3863 stop:5599 length:1737 start_codon:yes stop_codon:yes gene_type:complete
MKSAEGVNPPTPVDNETHDEYMARCTLAGHSEDACMVAHEGHTFMDQDKAHSPADHKASADCGCEAECQELDNCKEKAIAYEDWGEESEEATYFEDIAAEYGGKKVSLNKPFRTKGGNKKFAVYVKNKSGRVVIVRFGDPNMEIKRDDPKRRKAFRDRHNCAEKKDKTKAGYWSCKMWSKTPVNKLTQEAKGPCGCGCAEDEMVNVAIQLTVDESKLYLNASTGKTVVMIKGIAFHSGKNKNNWELGLEAGRNVVEQLKGIDLTLNHPKATAGGFGRNMDGGVDEAVVGVVTGAELTEEEEYWKVTYEAEVHRKELFEALESGLWLRPEYGVSIGGYGVPTKYEEKTGYAFFASDFTLDHLAIVHHPAYPDASIDEARVVSVKERAKPTATVANFKYGSAQVQANEALNMTDETIVSEINNDELDALKAELILSKATIEQFEAREAEKAEAVRESLVADATALGLKGHETLSADVITNLIASWKASNPEPEVVEMKPVEAATEKMVEASAPIASDDGVFVANYFNGTHLKTAESIYARAFNSWVSAYNRGLGAADDRATRYEDLSQGQKDILNFTEER